MPIDDMDGRPPEGLWIAGHCTLQQSEHLLPLPVARYPFTRCGNNGMWRISSLGLAPDPRAEMTKVDPTTTVEGEKRNEPWDAIRTDSTTTVWLASSVLSPLHHSWKTA